MNPHDSMLDDVAMYALGALDASEAATVRAHVASCAECAAAYARLRPVARVLVLDAQTDTSAPSDALKSRVMQAVRPHERRPVFRFAYAAAAACLIAAIVLAVFYGSAQQRANRLAAENSRKQMELADLTSPQAAHYKIPQGEVVARGRRLYIVMHRLPAPPSGKVYQAWTLPAGAKTVAPSITFVPSSGIAIVQLPENARNVRAVAVSVEPNGGSKQPTTKPLFLVRV